MRWPLWRLWSICRWTAFCSGRETHSLYPSAERVYDKSRIARQSTFSAWYPFGRFTCHLSVGRDFCIPIRLRRFWHPYSWGFAFRHSGGCSNRLLSWRSGGGSIHCMWVPTMWRDWQRRLPVHKSLLCVPPWLRRDWSGHSVSRRSRWRVRRWSVIGK